MSANQGGRLLIVDDKETMRSLLEKILGQRHQMTLASEGAQALELLAEREFDVVLTDLKMPGADGFAVVKAVRQRWPRTEVIMMTAFASIESAVQAIKLGAYDYLQKPFDPDDVALVVARALEHRRRETPAEASLADLPYKAALHAARDRVSRDYLVALMRSFAGNVTQAAEKAGIERESLHRLLKRHGLRAEMFRGPDEPGKP